MMRVSIPEDREATGHIPTFVHDCAQCVFLGHRQGYDVYVCAQHGLPTVIARYGNEGPEYASGSEFVTSGTFFEDGPATARARLDRAEKLGIPRETAEQLYTGRLGWENVVAAVLAEYVLKHGLLTKEVQRTT